MYTDGIKTFAKKEKDVETETTKIYSKVIGI